MMKFLHKVQTFLLIGAIMAAIYVVFLMPTGDGTAPVDQGGGAGVTTTQKDLNLYTYFNEAKSARGKITLDATFAFDNQDKLTVKSEQSFETLGGDSSIRGSTIYNMNGDAGTLDDIAYIQSGVKYTKGATAYVKSDHNTLNAGNMNISKIEEMLERQEDTVKEDGITCYKLTGTIMYADMSNDFRTAIREQGVNIGDIKNLPMDVTVFITENNLPYKIVFEFNDAQCMVKASALKSKNCLASGKLIVSFAGFNGVQQINFPSEIGSATDSTYLFTDKINRYLSKINY